MNWNNTLQSWFGNAQGSTPNQQLAQQNQSIAGAAQGLSNTVTTTTTGSPYYQQVTPQLGGLGNFSGYVNQTYQVPFNPPWPTMTLTLKDVALLPRMCGDDEEVREVLNKILPHFKLEA